MSERKAQIVLGLLAALLIGLGVWWWSAFMEKIVQGQPEISAEASGNPMLAATRLLKGRHFAVDTSDTLGEALLKPLPRGILLLVENKGSATQEQASMLRAWVGKGNMLIVRPRWKSAAIDKSEGDGGGESADAKDDKEDKDSKTSPKTTKTDKIARSADGDKSQQGARAVEPDPIGDDLGVGLMNRPSAAPDKSATPDAKPPERLFGQKVKPLRIFQKASLWMPHAAYALELGGTSSLFSTARARKALYGDDEQEAVRVYQVGRGKIVMLSDNFFDNANLGHDDHAELLLALTRVHSDAGGAKHLLIVKRFDAVSWFQALWSHIPLAIGAAGVGLLLLLWRAVCRFGPLLPEPDLNRRALMEHVEASGRWLWRVPGGREILLAAVRHSVKQILQRRAVDVMRLPPAEQAEKLAATLQLSQASLKAALTQPAAQVPHDFTRQIQTLQRIVKHYER